MDKAWFELDVEVIPAVDVLGVDAVRLERGDYGRVVESRESPGALAAEYAGAGARWVHVVDLDGARAGGVRPELVREVAGAAPGVRVQASGGIRTAADAAALLDAGADRVIVATAAVTAPAGWVQEFGARFVLALDVRDGEVRTSGWTAGSGLSLAAALELAGAAGVQTVLLTAIDRDGTLTGPDLELVRRVAASGAVPTILAAGGVRSVSDVTALGAAGAGAAVVGRALLQPFAPVDLPVPLEFG